MWHFHSRVHRVILILAIVPWFPAIVLGDDPPPVKVKVTFDEGTGMTADDKTAVIAAMKKKYTDAGITSIDFVTEGAGDLTLNFEASSPAKKFGDSNKKGHSCRMLAKFSEADLAIFDTAQKRRNVWAETGAHEVGHLLCAVHNKDKTTLMAQGKLVPDADRAADGRAFTGKDKTNILKGIEMLRAGKSWDLDAEFDNRTDFYMVPGLNTTPNRDDDSGVTFDVQISDPSYSVGFINDVGEYVELVGAGELGAAMEFHPGEFANFAIERFGEVTSFDKDLGNLLAQMPRSLADVDLEELPGGNPVFVEYFGKLTLMFDYLPSAPVLMLDANGFSDTNGFALVPEPTNLLLMAAGLGLYVMRRRRGARRIGR